MNEIVFAIFVTAAPCRIFSELILADTASPAASSSGEVILDPEDKRARERASPRVVSPSNLLLLRADMFELMTTNQYTSKRHNCTVTSILGRLMSKLKPFLFTRLS